MPCYGPHESYGHFLHLVHPPPPPLILITGPSSSPVEFRVVATGPVSISASWSPPPQEAQNGIITAYLFTCQPEELVSAIPATFPAAGSYSLSGFSPATTYNCSVLATTAGGSGPPALQTVTLLDDGVYMFTVSCCCCCCCTY